MAAALGMKASIWPMKIPLGCRAFGLNQAFQSGENAFEEIFDGFVSSDDGACNYRSQ